MRIVIAIFVLALLTIAGEIYSDAVLTSGQVVHQDIPDAVTTAIAHGIAQGKHGHPGV